MKIILFFLEILIFDNIKYFRIIKHIYNLKEAYINKLKFEQYKDNNTIKFGTILLENGKHNEAIDFVKSERREYRKQENIKYIFILSRFLVLLFIVYLISK